MILELDQSDKRHQQLTLLMFASNSVFEAHGALQNVGKLEEEKRIVLFSHLITAAVVCYARPFVTSRKSSRLGKRWEQFEDPKLLEFHRRVLRLRDKTIAHTDGDMNYVRVIDRNLKWTFARVDGGAPPFSFVHSNFTPVILNKDAIGEWEVDDFMGLCLLQKARLDLEVAALCDALRPEMKVRADNTFKE